MTVVCDMVCGVTATKKSPPPADRNPRLQPMEDDEYMIQTDRQAEDHAQRLRGDRQRLANRTKGTPAA